MENNFHSKLELFFEKQLERTNYWLSFAEAKNAVLIAFNAAAIAFIVNFQKTFPVFSTTIMILLLMPCIICLLSFFPNLKSRPPKHQHDTKNDNLVFWGDIANLKDEGRYIELVIARYFPEHTLEGESSKLCYDLASEIMINSRIAMYKYRCFKIALKLNILSFLLCILLFILA